MVTQPQAPVGISIPAIGVGLQPETANPAETNTITAFHTIGFVKVGQRPIEIRRRTAFTDSGTVDETIVISASCKGDGRQFTSDADVWGPCFSCKFIVCVGCHARYECTSCGRQACPDCGSYQHGVFYCCVCQPIEERVPISLAPSQYRIG